MYVVIYRYYGYGVGKGSDRGRGSGYGRDCEGGYVYSLYSLYERDGRNNYIFPASLEDPGWGKGGDKRGGGRGSGYEGGGYGGSYGGGYTDGYGGGYNGGEGVADIAAEWGKEDMVESVKEDIVIKHHQMVQNLDIYYM